jgi:hypothetical protein
MIRTNRSLRATVITITFWIGVRSSFLLLSSGVEPSRPPARTQETGLPIKQAIVSADGIAPLSIAKRIVEDIQTRSNVRFMAIETHKASFQPAPIAKARDTRDQPFFLSAPDTHPLPKPAPAPVAQPEYIGPTQSGFVNPSVSAWAIIRPANMAAVLATAGQLGASQAGVRIQQPIIHRDANPRVAINLRLSTPVDQNLGSEAGIGFAARPIKRVPVEFIVERRVALDRGGRNAFAVIAAGGFDDEPVIRAVTMSGYAQTGIVGFGRKDRFIDGALRIEQPLRDYNRTGLRIGGGLWGAAQPDVARLDAGPILALKQAVGSVNLRVAAEYRWRIAGQARPASGPALSIGTDF